MDDQVPVKTTGFTKSLLLVIAGLIGLTLDGKWIVDGAVTLAKSFGMSESLVGLTIAVSYTHLTLPTILLV